MSVIEGTFDVSGFIDAQPVRGRQYAVTVLYGLRDVPRRSRYAIDQLCGAAYRQRVDFAASGFGTDLFFRPDRPDGWLPFHIPLIGSLRSSTNDDRQHNRLWPVHRAQRHNNQCYRAFGLALPDRCRAGRRGAKRGSLDERIQSEAVACDIRTSDYCGFSLGFVAAGSLAAWLLPSLGWRSLFWVGAAAPLIISFFLVTSLPESFHFLINSGASSEKVRDVFTNSFPARRALLTLSASPLNRKVEELQSTILFKGARGVGTVIIWVVFFLNLAESTRFKAGYPQF